MRTCLGVLMTCPYMCSPWNVSQADSVATVNIAFKASPVLTKSDFTALPLRAHFRIPGWADNATVSVNSVAWHGCLGAESGQRQPLAGSFCVVQRDFQAGMCLSGRTCDSAVWNCMHARPHPLCLASVQVPPPKMVGLTVPQGIPSTSRFPCW